MKNQEGKKADKIKAKAKKHQQKHVSIENVAGNIESLTAIQHVEETIKESVSPTTVGSVTGKICQKRVVQMTTAKLINILYHLDQKVLKYDLLLHVLALISAALNELILK